MARMLINNIGRPASGIVSGLVSTTSQTFAGAKTFSNKALFSAGSAAEPSLSFSDDDDTSGTGVYRVGQNSLGFSANGLNVGEYSASGIWRIGPSAGVSGTAVSTASSFLVGGDDLHPSGSFLIVGRRSSGTKVAYIVAGNALECGMEFASRNSSNAYLNVGGYSSAGAWTLGTGTGEIHRLNCQTNAGAPGAVATYLRLNVNGTVYKIALLGNT